MTYLRADDSSWPNRPLLTVAVGTSLVRSCRGSEQSRTRYSSHMGTWPWPRTVLTDNSRATINSRLWRHQYCCHLVVSRPSSSIYLRSVIINVGSMKETLFLFVITHSTVMLSIKSFLSFFSSTLDSHITN